jgi:hypothetical protein
MPQLRGNEPILGLNRSTGALEGDGQPEGLCGREGGPFS